MRDEQWQAIVECDESYDGQFFYAVRTTGIFCRPSCKSRTPRRSNVELFSTREAALAAHYRPCKRCRPEQLRGPDEELAHRLLKIVENRFQEPWTLALLAKELHVSPYHLHHIFKRVTGKTPADLILETRLATAKRMLIESDQKIAEIAGAVGFSNMAHFSAVFQKQIGMSPTAYRSQVRSAQSNLEPRLLNLQDF